MRRLFSNPIVSRVVGALGAGVATAITQVVTTGKVDVATCVTASVGFAVYGTTHKTTEQSASK